MQVMDPRKRPGPIHHLLTHHPRDVLARRHILLDRMKCPPTAPRSPSRLPSLPGWHTASPRSLASLSAHPRPRQGEVCHRKRTYPMRSFLRTIRDLALSILSRFSRASRRRRIVIRPEDLPQDPPPENNSTLPNPSPKTASNPSDLPRPTRKLSLSQIQWLFVRVIHTPIQDRKKKRTKQELQLIAYLPNPIDTQDFDCLHVLLFLEGQTTGVPYTAKEIVAYGPNIYALPLAPSSTVQAIVGGIAKVSEDQGYATNVDRIDLVADSEERGFFADGTGYLRPKAVELPSL